MGANVHASVSAVSKETPMSSTARQDDHHRGGISHLKASVSDPRICGRRPVGAPLNMSLAVRLLPGLALSRIQQQLPYHWGHPGSSIQL